MTQTIRPTMTSVCVLGGGTEREGTRILNRMLRIAFIEKVAFEQPQEG